MSVWIGLPFVGLSIADGERRGHGADQDLLKLSSCPLRSPSASLCKSKNYTLLVYYAFNKKTVLKVIKVWDNQYP